MKSVNKKPVIAAGYRLQWEPAQRKYVLLFPEGIITLNDSAALILRLCDGQHTPDDIANQLSAEFHSLEIKDDIQQFLKIANDNKWIHYS